MVYRAGVLSQLAPKMALPSAADALPEEGVCRSADSSCAEDIATLGGHCTHQGCRLGVCGEEQEDLSDHAAASEAKNSPLSLDVHDANHLKVSFLYADNTLSTEDYYWPILRLLTSKVERSPSLWHSLKLLNISTTSSKTDFFTEAKNMEQFEYLVWE